MLGIALGGVGGALINNNSTSTMYLTEKWAYLEQVNQGQLTNQRTEISMREAERLKASVAGIHTMGFGIGSILGPILGSSLDSLCGYSKAYMYMGIIVWAFSFP